ELVRRHPELDRDLSRALREPLAGAHVERRSLPAPVVDKRAQRDVGLRPRSWSDPRLLAVAVYRGALDEPTRVLAAYRAPRDVAVGDRAERAQHLHLLVAHGLVVEGGRPLHRDEGEELQQ